MRYRMSAIKCAERYGVQKAAMKCHASPASIYRWQKMLETGNGDIRSLAKQSTRPHHHPNEHTRAEITLIKNLRKRNPNIGLQDLWIKLKKRGYRRSQPALLKILRRLEMPTNQKTRRSPTCVKNHTYEQMTYPGERVQIDVKYVPKECLSNEFKQKYPELKLYQYTAIDEYSRYRILGGYHEHDTYASSLFLCQVVSAFKAIGIEVKCVQTDNGAEFTKQFLAKKENNHSMFETTAHKLGIKIKRIKPHTPKHNGKVERSHREDQKLFYSEMVRLNHLITDVEGYKRRLKRHQDKTNNRPMRPLGYLSPIEYIEQYKNKQIKR